MRYFFVKLLDSFCNTMSNIRKTIYTKEVIEKFGSGSKNFILVDLSLMKTFIYYDYLFI